MLFGIIFTPIFINFCVKKGFYKEISDRDIHSQNIPNIGGVSIFLSFFFSILIIFLVDKNLFISFHNLIPIIFIAFLFFIIGLYDDIKYLSFFKKFFAQFLLCSIIVFYYNIKIDSFYGLFGLYNLSPLFLKMFSTLVFVFIINAYNLTDGIDGLASVIGIFVSCVFSIIFYMNSCFFEFYSMIIILFSLLTFLLYNKPSAKIFMGDSGSLFIGFLLGLSAIKICNLPIDSINTINPVFALCVLAYPSIDTLRVFLIRIINGKSPFEADRNHIHHIMIKNGFSHFLINILVFIYSSILTFLCYLLRDSINLSFFLMLILSILLINLLINQFKSIFLKNISNLKN